MNVINSTALDLLRLTLLSMYIMLTNACWLPFLSHFPSQIMLFLQFFLIAIPQSMIVIYPEHSNKQYAFFTIFGTLGTFFSYLRFKMIKNNIIAKTDIEGEVTEKSQFLDKFFDTSPKHSKKSNSISCYQTCIMIMTVTAISAVDFSAFPPQFRKTKQYGLSLMDIGVSLIITAGGLVMGKYLHGKSRLSVQKVIQMTWPTLAFGVVRGVLGQYNIGADEYGRHWSFFLNLSFLPYTLLFWNLLPSPHLLPFICAAVMIGYQYLLSKHAYAEYIFNKNTSSFFESNKVGIFSLVGYACLFSMSCYLGRIFQKRHSNFKQAFLTLCCFCLLFWSWFFFSSSDLLPSRTLANLNYVVWSLANGSIHYVLLTVSDFAVPEKYRFVILADMVSEYRLSIFIIANVLSHLIRLKCAVKAASKAYLAGIISSYMFVTLAVVTIFYLRLFDKIYSILFKRK